MLKKPWCESCTKSSLDLNLVGRKEKEVMSHPQVIREMGVSFQRLKELDDLLDNGQQGIANARNAYQQTLADFASLCHQLWLREKAQGNRHGKGFRQSLADAGIKAGRAYRAMKKFFPADFPVQPKPLKKKPSSTSFAADKVAVPGFRVSDEGVLECLFALTAEEKAEFSEALKLVDVAQVQRLLLASVKQAADAQRRTGPQKQNHCQGKINSHVKQNDEAKPPAASPGHTLTAASGPLPLEVQVAYSQISLRLGFLQNKLLLKDHYPDLMTQIRPYPPHQLNAKLDWIDKHPEWCARLHGRSGLEFVEAFKQI